MPRPSPTVFSDPERVVTVEIETPPIEASPVVKVGTATKAGKILLLEDRDDFQEVLGDHLRSRSFQVTSVPSGVEGLREVSNGAFDLILCDMMMPRMGGEMFYWAVTRMRPATAQRFIFFTGHRNNPAIEFFFQRVNATVLIKPFQLTELNTAMDSVLRKVA